MKIVVRTRNEWKYMVPVKMPFEMETIEETIMHNSLLYRWHCKSQHQFAYKIN